MNGILLLSAVLIADVLGPGDHSRQLVVDDLQRSYLVHVPPQYPDTSPLPLVLAFHGAGMNGKLMSQWTQLNNKADQAGFVVVYPNGTGIADLFLTFNVGQGKTDEVKFVEQLLDDLKSQLRFDAQRTYATGYSNGGMLCYVLAAKLTDRIAAIAPVAAISTITPEELSRAVPVIHFHGTDDMWVRWEPRNSTRSHFLSVRSVRETIRLWTKLDGCPTTPKVTDLPNTKEDETTVRQEYYGPGRDNSAVVLTIIQGGGHTWPGQQPALEILGQSTEDISANDLIWDFFQQYRLP
jgi:polyhydroxybutyrate depolymerase